LPKLKERLAEVELLLADPDQYRDSERAAATVKEYNELTARIEAVSAERIKLRQDIETMKSRHGEIRGKPG
jgi:protein subunit release factor A